MAIVRNTIKFSSGGGGADITVVANYSALPDPTTVSGQFYWCSASQGTSWLPGSLGGTYYNSGMYYSNGTTWEFLNVPYNATQSEVNTGTNNDKFVTPKTFTDASKWNDFLAKSTIVSSNTTASNDANYTVVANATFTDPSPIEGKGYITYVRNGTATIGGVGYGVGKLIYRTFHSGSWNTVIFIDQTALDAKVEDAIVNGVTDKAPSQNAVFDALNLKANLTQVGNLLREEFTFTSSQTFTLSNNYGQVYSVEVQGQGALSTSQYTLVAPNQITINDTLDSGDYIVVIYSNAIAGIQPYYSQAEVDALLNLKQNNLGYTPPQTWKSGIDGISVANTLTITPTYTQLIPANTFAEGDVVELLFRSTSPGAKTSASSNYVYINTTNNLSGTPIQVGILTGGATTRTIQLERTLSIKGATTKVINPTGTTATDTGLTASMSTLTIDWTVNQYFVFAIGHTVADQTMFGDFYRIIKN